MSQRKLTFGSFGQVAGGSQGDNVRERSPIRGTNYDSGIEQTPVKSSGVDPQAGGSGQIAAPQIQGSVSAGDSTMVEPQAGGGVPGGTGSSQAPITIKNAHAPDITFKFNKSFQIYTGGYQFVDQPRSFIQTPNVNWDNVYAAAGHITSTPLSVIDPNDPAWFMNKIEFQSLPPNSYATRCTVKVTPLGYRLPFATNEATSTFANSQCLVQGCTAVGLNTIVNGFTASYQAADGDLSKPTGTQSVDHRTEVMLYGSATKLGANLGFPVHNNLYYCTVTPGTSNTHGINLTDHMEIFNINDHKGLPCVNYEYNYKNALLVPTINSQNFTVRYATLVPEGTNPIGFYNRAPRGGGNLSRNMQMHGTDDDWILAFDYTSPIDKAPWMSRQYGQRLTPDAPPLVLFGCMPVQSNAALAATPTFADVVIQWGIQTEIHVTCNINSIHPEANIPYLKSYDPTIGRQIFTGMKQSSGLAYQYNRQIYFPNAAAIVDQYETPVIIKETGPPLESKRSIEGLDDTEDTKKKMRNRIDAIVEETEESDMESIVEEPLVIPSANNLSGRVKRHLKIKL